jgi:hypothetical protein
LQRGVDAVEHGFLAAQRRFDAAHIAGVLGQHVFLLLQLQQASRAHRIIRSSLDAHARVNLLLGFDHRREVVLVGAAGRFKKLGSRNAHRRGLP